jgi:autotransporter-associated beta strand protein
VAGDIVNNSTNLQTVNVGLAMQQNTNFNAAAGDLTVGGNISGSFSITKTGAHTLTLTGTNTYTGPTTVSAGTLVVGAAGALPGGAAVSINGGSAMQLALNIGAQTISSLAIPSTGMLDITTDAVIINYGSGPDPIASIAAYIASGYNNGSWNGPGILSSIAAANPNTGIGFADSADPGNPAGLSAGEIEIVYTLLGDANLDGKVNGTDFAILATSFNQAVNGWDEGDFNYDGKANGTDFASLAANFNQGLGASVAEVNGFALANGLAAVDPMLANVPEPDAIGLGLTAIGFFSTARRRRR